MEINLTSILAARPDLFPHKYANVGDKKANEILILQRIRQLWSEAEGMSMAFANRSPCFYYPWLPSAFSRQYS